MLENTERAIKHEPSRKTGSIGRQDTGQINVREYRKCNEK
jgi:hypothetical protein